MRNPVGLAAMINNKRLGVNQDRIRAMMWFTIAVKNSKGKVMRKASKARGRLMGRLNERQISKARKMAEEMES